MGYKVTKQDWTGTRITQKRGITGLEEANGIAATLALARKGLISEAEIAHGFKVQFKLGGRMVPDCYYIVERDDS